MNLIDRYVAEVGRHLPEKNRSDIEAEIRTMLEDMLEERGEQTKSADETVIAQVLEQLGDPKLLASKYAPARRYLIGPDWYEVYIQTLQRVLGMALPIFAVVTVVLRLTDNPMDFASAFGKALGGAFEVGLQVVFWVTVIFIFLERSDEVPDKVPGTEHKAWTVAQLPKTPLTRQISIGEALTDIVMELFLLVWIVLPPIQSWLQGEIDYVPFLHPNLWNLWLPILFVLLALSLIHDVFKLRIGNWTPALTLTNVILGTASIIYILALVSTQQVINPAFWATPAGAQLAQLRDVTIWSTWSVNITVAILIGIFVWDIFNSIRLARRLHEPSGMVASVKNVV